MRASQRMKIIEYIRKHGSITPIEAFYELGITKLATRISELKREGERIVTETVYDVNRDGKPNHYCKYSLEGEEA